MAFPNISDILDTTIESRTRQIADNVTKNNAIPPESLKSVLLMQSPMRSARQIG